MWLERAIYKKIISAIDRGKNILFLGPRQTGKTSLVKRIKHDIYITLMDPSILQKYESNPNFFIEEIRALAIMSKNKVLVIIDEVQKIPTITDSIQILIDEGSAQFIITGSSARKIRNLLPGRVIKYTLSPLCLTELPTTNLNLNNIIVNGALPEIFKTKEQESIDELISTYVELYIEEEIRKEALVRNIGKFNNFLKLACIESGNIVNLSKLGSEIGVSHQTIAEYYRILEDCMLVEKIDALTKTNGRKRLSKSPKYIMFDLGVKRVGAAEPHAPSIRELSLIFEQFIGLELIRIIRQKSLRWQLMYWRSHDGPEVDFVISTNNKYIPIEVKWTDNPNLKDCKHLITFANEYDVQEYCYIICLIETPRLLGKNIMALPWQELPRIFDTKY